MSYYHWRENMNINYQQVPNIISGKDLDYLSDMFNWNCSAYKKAKNCIGQIQDAAIQELFNKAATTFLDNTNSVLSILNGGGSNE